MAWNVGNGKEIGVWHDKWIVDIKGMKLKCERIPDDLKNLKVTDFIDKEGRLCDLSQISSVISKEEGKLLGQFLCLVSQKKTVWYGLL